MILNERQEKEFIDWYKSIYGDTKSAGGLPRIHESKQREHIKMWKEFLEKLLGKDAKNIYVHRGGRKEDFLHLLFGSLYLNYGPIYVDDNGETIEDLLWIDDIE